MASLVRAEYQPYIVVGQLRSINSIFSLIRSVDLTLSSSHMITYLALAVQDSPKIPAVPWVWSRPDYNTAPDAPTGSWSFPDGEVASTLSWPQDCSLNPQTVKRNFCSWISL